MFRVLKGVQVDVGLPRAIEVISLPADEAVSGEVLLPQEDPQVDPEEIIEQARSEARQILDEARRKADKVLEEALQGAEEIVAEARRIGFEEGRRLGIQDGLKQVNQFIDEARAIVDLARKEKDLLIERSRPEIIELALATAERIIRRQVQEDPDTVARLLAEVLDSIRGGAELQVRVHPRDAVALHSQPEGLRLNMPEIKSLTIVEDQGIEPGGAWIETGYGSIDARVETQISKLREALLTISEGGIGGEPSGGEDTTSD